MKISSQVTNYISALVIAFVAFLATYSYASIPDLEANRDERSLSNPAYVLGQHWFRELNGSRALIDFPPAYNYLKNTISTLLPQTGLYDKTIEMTLLNSSKSNAFVIPGNHLFIYSDILEMIDGENMLYALLAHELAHLDARHYERRQQKSSEELNKALLLIGAGIAASLAGAGGDTTSALWLGGIANQASNTLSYSRSQEQEADRRGKQYLVDAGLSSDGMTELFQAFLKKSLGRPKLEFLQTHPLPDSRLADTLQIEQPKTLLRNKTNSDFDFFRATLLSYRAGLETNPYEYLSQQIPNLDAQAFAKGLFSYLTNSPQKALSFLSEIKDKKNNEFTQYLLALSYMSAQQNEEALKVIKENLALAPKNILFAMLYSQLTHSRPASDPAQYLYQKRLIWRAQIQYYRYKDNLPMALNYKALLDFSQGQDKEAGQLVKRALLQADEADKEEIKKTQNYFEQVKEAELDKRIDN